MSSLIGFTRRHPLPVFFGLAYALSWWPAFFVSGALNPFGPLIAAVLVALTIGGRGSLKEWWHRVTRWRGSPWWYVLALVLPFTINLAAASLNVLLGAPFPSGADIARWPELFIIFPLYLIVFGPLGEETGWRGFAMPRLMGDHAALNASLILGLFVAVWHLPLILTGEQASIILIAVVASQVMYTWLANHVEGKVLIVMIAHAAQGGLGGEYFGSMFSGTYATQQTAMLVVVQSAVAVALVVLTGVRLGRRSEPVEAPAMARAA